MPVQIKNQDGFTLLTEMPITTLAKKYLHTQKRLL